MWFESAVETPWSDLAKTLSAGALGFVGTLITVGAGWLKDRDASAKRAKQIEEASKMVAFWKAWLEAVEPVVTEAERISLQKTARDQLRRVSKDLQSLFAESSDAGVFSKKTKEFLLWRRSLPRWRRWPLLYTPPRARAWLPRMLFYVYVCIAPLFFWRMQRDFIANQKELEEHSSYTATLERMSPSGDPSAEKAMHEEVHGTDAKRAALRREFEGRDAEVVTILLLMGFGFRAWSMQLEQPEPHV